MPRRRTGNPWQPRYIPAAPLKTADVLGAMAALAPTADAAARVAALGERWAQRAAPLKEEAGPKKGAGNTNHERGMEAESWARQRIKKAGWFINSSRTGSFGAADVLAHRTDAVAANDRPGVETLHIQVKRLADFAPSGLNGAVRAFLHIGPKYAGVALDLTRRLTAANSRECWLFCDHEGWVAVAVLGHDGAVTVSGPRGEAVGRALAAMQRKEGR